MEPTSTPVPTPTNTPVPTPTCTPSPSPTATPTPAPTATPTPTPEPTPDVDKYAKYLDSNDAIVLNLRDDLRVFRLQDWVEYDIINELYIYVQGLPVRSVEGFRVDLPEYYGGTIEFYSDTAYRDMLSCYNIMCNLIYDKLEVEYPEYAGKCWAKVQGGIDLKEILANKESFTFTDAMVISVYEDTSYEVLLGVIEVFFTIDFEFME